MADFNVKPVGTLPTASQPQIDGGQVIIVYGANAYRASSQSMKGAKGDGLEIRNQSGYIQTRPTGGAWSNLIEIDSLKGNKGDNATNPNFTFVINALSAETPATSEISGTYPNLTLTLGIPSGKDAVSPEFSIDVDALEADADPTSEITGTYPNLTLKLGIPRGRDAEVPVFTAEAEKGKSGSNPDVELSGNYPNLHLKYLIPEGKKGDKGNVMFATFEIDFETGCLIMTTPSGYDGADFEINRDDGCLYCAIEN